jgi:signal transduction histidine kinase
MELRLERGAAILSIEDDGDGFSAPIYTTALLRSGHFGLASMRERAERLGGSLEIVSDAGCGSRLCMQIPCKPTLMHSTPVTAIVQARTA